MKTRLFTLLAVLAVLAILATQLPVNTVAAAPRDPGLQFNGTIRWMPAHGLLGTWNVNGLKVHVSAATKIDQTDGKAVKGAPVHVEGYKLLDGSIRATSIDVLPSAPQP